MISWKSIIQVIHKSSKVTIEPGKSTPSPGHPSEVRISDFNLKHLEFMISTDNETRQTIFVLGDATHSGKRHAINRLYHKLTLGVVSHSIPFDFIRDAILVTKATPLKTDMSPKNG